ncbi:Hypothetical predicted protein [Paramuricea clavata]|uniref:Uncharacterized protein n=1 Tax=Paramuricea clavata TaxID=317549 RepID=A0A6S7L2B2_PARCT|nr:Hypothetical predicted protein [Paramuricea clavata]
MAAALHMFDSSEDESDFDWFLIDETVEETQPIAAGTSAVSWRDIAGNSDEEEDFDCFSDIKVFNVDEVCEREVSTKALFDSEPEADGETTEGETTEDEKQDTGDEDFHCEEGIESESEDNTETR